ncbi:MAG: hypothetical protein HY906_01870 [Deltaproteobacteria bacterium]|nr:hypothetical protein [Deltaproteobacteria bacterium]
MGELARQLFETALKLPTDERAALAAELMASIDGEPDADAEEASLKALERAAGELRARDPDRSVAFVTADRHTALGEVVAVMAALRVHYPNVVLGATGPAFTQGEGPGRRRRP